MDELMGTPMEQQEEILTLDSIAREQLSEAARWARFLAIMGFIGCGLIVVAGVFMAIVYSYLNNHIATRYNYYGQPIRRSANGSGYIGVIYVFISVTCFFSCLYLYRFADKMRAALHNHSQDSLNDSITNLKKMFRYNGILTIVMVLLYVVILFAVMIAALNR